MLQRMLQENAFTTGK